MLGLEHRRDAAHDTLKSHSNAARWHLACEIAGIDVRTLQRWKGGHGPTVGDGTPTAVRRAPAHALSAQEREELLRVANAPRFADVPPARIVSMLADEGVYLASGLSSARVRHALGQSRHRNQAKGPGVSKPPTTHAATGPRQVWCRDMTYLPSKVAGRWSYLYLSLDIYIRKVIGWQVHEKR